MLNIKVLGSGCENCHKLEAIARQAVGGMGMQAEIIKVTDWEEIKKSPILATPGLVINEKLVCAGRVPNAAEVTTWLVNAEMEAAWHVYRKNIIHTADIHASCKKALPP